MNDKITAEREIKDFLTSSDRFLFLSGTNQFKKHSLVLKILCAQSAARKTVLFRGNSMDNVSNFLSDVFEISKKPKTGTPILIAGKHQLYCDTINSKSWGDAPRPIDIGIIYPIDSLDYLKDDSPVQDLIRRQAKKIFLITWTDNKDFSWVSSLTQRHVVYDAEDEDPEYHKRVLEVTEEVDDYTPAKKLPAYAKGTPGNLLVRCYCNTCRGMTYAKLNKPHPGKTILRNAQMGEYSAACLKCRHEANDNYNWS